MAKGKKRQDSSNFAFCVRQAIQSHGNVASKVLKEHALSLYTGPELSGATVSQTTSDQKRKQFGVHVPASVVVPKSQSSLLDADNLETELNRIDNEIEQLTKRRSLVSECMLVCRRLG